MAIAAVAAALSSVVTGLVVGGRDAGAAVGCGARDARVRLEVLPEGPRGAGGYACLRIIGGQRRLVVHAEGMSAPGSGEYEAWLLDDSGPTVRAEALGVLGSGSDPAFNVADSLDLSRYNIIDISAEPHDGDAGHSGHSMLRGRLG